MRRRAGLWQGRALLRPLQRAEEPDSRPDAGVMQNLRCSLAWQRQGCMPESQQAIARCARRHRRCAWQHPERAAPRSRLGRPPPPKRVTFAEEALHKKQKVIGRAPLLAVRDPERASHVPHRPDSITPLMAFLDGYYQGAAGGSMVPKCARVELVEEIGCQMLFG